MQSNISEFYARYIKPLPTQSRLQLLAVIADDLAHLDDSAGRPERSLLEMEGLGAEIWQGIDAQAYVDGLRGEWDHRP